MPELTPQQKAQLDKNIKAMLSQGASEQDVISYATDFRARFDVKKKVSIADVGMAARGGGGVGVSKAPSGETEQETPEQKLSKLGLNVTFQPKQKTQYIGTEPVTDYLNKLSKEPDYIDLSNSYDVGRLSGMIDAKSKTDKPVKASLFVSDEMVKKAYPQYAKISGEKDKTVSELKSAVSDVAAQNAFDKIASKKDLSQITRDDLLEAGLEYTKQVAPSQWNRNVEILEGGKDLGDENKYNLEKAGAAVLLNKGQWVIQDENTLQQIAKLGQETDAAHPKFAVAKAWDIISAYNHKKDNKANGGWWRTRPSLLLVENWLEEPELKEMFVGNEVGYNILKKKLQELPNEKKVLDAEDVSISGGLNRFTQSIAGGVENIGNIFDSDAKRQQSNLNPTLGRGSFTGNYQIPGESNSLLQRIQQLKDKEKQEKLTPEEWKELDALNKSAKVRSGWDKFKDGTFDVLGQVVLQAALTKGVGVGGKIITSAKAPILLKTGISTALISYDQSRKSAVYHFPKDDAKQNIYIGAMTAANILSERIFKDEKVFNAFRKGLDAELATTLKNISVENISRQQVKSIIVNNAVKYGFRVGVDANKNAFEEMVVQAVDEGLKTTMSAEDYDETKALKNIADVYVTTLYTMGAVSALSAIKSNTKADKFNSVALYRGALDPQKTKQDIERLYETGEITEQEKDEKLNILAKASLIIEAEPSKIAAKSVKDKAQYLVNALNAELKKEQLEKVVDKNEAKELSEEIKDSENKAAEIYNALTPEQKILQQAIDNNEIVGIYLDIAKTSVNDPKEAKLLLDNAKSQIEGQVAGNIGTAREGVEKAFGKSIVDFVLPKSEAGSVDIVGGEISKFPFPGKDITDMNSTELEEYLNNVKKYYKETKLTKEQEDKLEGEAADKYFGKNLPEDGVYDPIEIQRIINRVSEIEQAETAKEISEWVKRPLIDFARKQDKENLSVIKAAKRRADELGISSEELIKESFSRVSGEIKDAEVVDKIFKSIKSEQPKAAEQSLSQSSTPTVQEGKGDKGGEDVVGKTFRDNYNRTFEVKGENAGILTLEDVDTGKVLRKKKSEVLSDFKEITDSEVAINDKIISDAKVVGDAFGLKLGKSYKGDDVYVGEIKNVRLNPKEFSVSEFGQEEKVNEEGAENIDLSEPIEAEVQANGAIKVTDGHHRLWAARKLGKDLNVNLTIPSTKIKEISPLLNEIYQNSKADGTNPELVKAVEQSLKETPKAQAGSVGVVDVVEGETKVVNGRELTFYNIKGYDESTGFAVEKNKNGYIIHSAMIPMAKQRQGIGTDFYIRMNKESIKSTGNPLKSSERLSNSAGKPFWEKLVDKGYAEKAEDGYKFILSTKGSEIKPENAIEVDRNVDRKVANVPNGVKGKLAAFKEKYAAKEPEPEIAAPKPKVVSKDKQTRTNDIVSRVRQFNQLRKNAPNKASELNAIRIEAKELGYEVKYGKGLVFLKTTSGNKVQSKSSETNSSIAKNFSKDNYSPETNSHIETILADDGIMTGLPIKGEDGYRLSEKQKASALKSIRDGKPINGAKAIYDFLEKAVNDGEIEIEDKITGQEVKVPVSEYFDAFKEPVKEITDTELDELNSMLNEEAFKEAFENEKNIVYEADNEGSSEPVGKTAEGQTIENQKAAISGKEAAGVSGKTPEGVRKKISFERNDEKIKEKLKNIDSLLKDLGKPDLTMGGLSKIEPLTKLIGNLVEVGYYKIEDIAKFLIEKGYNEWIPYLKDAYNDFKDKYDLSPEVKSALSNGNEINSFAGGLDKGTPASQKVNDIQGRRTPTGTVGGKVAAGRPPIRIADEKNLPTPKKEHIVDGKYDIDENQRLGANLAIDRFDRGGKAFLLADGAGVGKTREILVVAKEMADKTGKKTLIVTESNAILADTYAKDADALGIDLNKFEVGTYSDLAAGKIGKGDYGIAIYDESHNLKNPLAQRSIAQSKVKSSHNMFASATPMDKVEHAIYFLSEITDKTPKEIEQELGVDIEFKKGRDGETYSIATTSMGAAHYVEKLLELRGEAVKNGSLIRREYPFYGEMENKQVNMSAKDNAEKNKIEEIHANRMDNADNIAIGRLVNEKLNPRKEGGQFGEFKNDLANKMAFQGLFDKIKKDYEAGRGGYYSEAKAAIDKFTKDERFALLQNLDKINEQAKANDIYESVKKDLADGKQSIVVGNYSGEHTIKAGTKNSKYGYYEKTIPSEQTLLNAVAKKLEAEGIKVSRIYGGNKAGSYTKEQNDFQSGKTKVMLMTAKSGGTGINLDDVNGNAPRVMHIATSEYSGNKTEQLFGRVSRRNTKSPAEIKSYFFDNMADNNRAAKSKEKQATIRNIVAGKEDLDKGRIAEAGGELSTTKEKKEANIGLEKSAPGKFVLTGDTFDIKDTIKELGGRWEKYKKGWEFPESKQDEVKAALAEKHPDIKLNFSIQEKTPEAISDMKDIVKDLVEDGTSSLKDIQKVVADELGDKSQEMKDLVEDAYNEFGKEPIDNGVTTGVIGQVGKFVSRLFGGKPQEKVYIARNTEALMKKAEEVVNPQFQNQPLTPEQKATTDLLNAAKNEYQVAKNSFDAKRKSLDKEVLKDQEDLFGERKATQEAAGSLFDERVSQSARNKAIEPYKARMLKAENEVNRLQKKLDGLGSTTAQTSLFMKSPDGKVLGFTHNNKIYLNGEHLNPNTPIHEAGHIWTEWSKQNQPEVYKKGMQLVSGTRYLKKAQESKFYQAEAAKLPKAEKEAYFKHEALAMAIGDKGAQFVTEARKASFKEWLSNLWDSIKKAAGFKDITAKELSKLTFDEFTKRAAKDILADESIQAKKESTTLGEADQNKQGAGKEPPKPPKEEPSPLEGDEGREERRFTKQMLRSELSDNSKGEIAKSLNYIKQTNQMSVKEANDIIDYVGLDEAQNVVMNDSDIKPVVRVVMGQILIKKFNELADQTNNQADKNYYLDKTIQVANFVTEKLATEAGQQIQAFSLWSRLSPEGQIRAANQDIAKQGKEKVERRRKDINKIGTEFQKANEEAAEEVSKLPSIDESVKKDDNEKLSKAKVKIAKAKAKRASIIKKYKDKKGGGLTLTSGGLTTEGIEFIGEVTKTYIDEGIANVQLLVEKAVASFKEVTGKDPDEKIKAQIFDEADKQLNKADIKLIGDALKDRNIKISKVVKEHYTVVEKAKKSLAQKLMDEAGMEQSNAKELSDKVQAAFDRIASRKKRNILYKEKARFDKINNTLKGAKKVEKNTVADDIIKYTNLGAFDNNDFTDMLSDKFGVGEISPEQAAKLKELADKIQKAPEGSLKRDATEDLLAYRAKIRGNDLGETAQAVWYANVLSGYKTQEKNLVSTFFQSMGELVSQMSIDPKGIPYILSGYVKGVTKRGFIEALNTLTTGRSPIHIKKIETPNALERKNFKGGGYNPANWFKYVMRTMIAFDVITFQGLKEARAYQLARREASKMGFNTWSKKGWDKVNEILYHTEQRWREAELQAEEEGLSKVAKRRRVYELMEESRPQEMKEQSYGFAAKGTFNHETEGTLGALTNALSGMLNAVNIKGVQPLRFVIPFTRIITNVVNNTLDYTPIGLVRAARGVRGFKTFEKSQLTKSAFKELTTEERKTLIAKAAIGITLTAALQALHIAGVIVITGGGPDDEDKKRQLRESGWQPYSVKVGDKWYSYQYTPLVFMLGYLGNMNDADKYLDDNEDTFGKRVQLATSRIGGQVVYMTWINSASTFMGALAEPDPEQQSKKLQYSLAGMARGFVPFSGFINQSSEAVQKIYNMPQKQVNNAWQGLIQNVPIARNSLNDKINALGEPIVRDIDVFISTETNDPVWKFLLDKGGWVATVNRGTLIKVDKATGEEVPYTDDEYYEFSKLRGQKIKTDLEVLIRDGYYFIRNGVSTFVPSSDFKPNELNLALTELKKRATSYAKYKLFGVAENNEDLDDENKYLQKDRDGILPPDEFE